jgi:hypothetical protein
LLPGVEGRFCREFRVADEGTVGLDVSIGKF